MRAMIIRLLLSLGIPALAAVTGAAAGADIALPGLSAPVRVLTDADGVRHIEAANDLDGARAQGFVHCRDRLFQMDDTRRQVDGTEAELLGPGSPQPGRPPSRIEADIQARIIGLHRAAQRSLDAAPSAFKALLEAYADGVNHCIATVPLPPEYALLELTQVRPWQAVDSAMIGKAIAASLSLDVDTGLTEDLLAFVSAAPGGLSTARSSSPPMSSARRRWIQPRRCPTPRTRRPSPAGSASTPPAWRRWPRRHTA